MTTERSTPCSYAGETAFNPAPSELCWRWPDRNLPDDQRPGRDRRRLDRTSRGYRRRDCQDAGNEQSERGREQGQRETAGVIVDVACEDRPQDLACAKRRRHQSQSCARISASTLSCRDKAECRQTHEGSTDEDRRHDNSKRGNPNGAGRNADRLNDACDGECLQSSRPRAQPRPQGNRGGGAPDKKQPEVGFEGGDPLGTTDDGDDERGRYDIAEAEQAVRCEQR